MANLPIKQGWAQTQSINLWNQGWILKLLPTEAKHFPVEPDVQCCLHADIINTCARCCVVVTSLDEVTLCRAGLVLGWVTVFGR